MITISTLFVGCTYKPEPLSDADVQKDATTSMQYLKSYSQKVTAPMTLDEAIGRAIQYNLKSKLAMMNSALAVEESKLVSYEALPAMTASAGYSHRNNYSASASTTFDNNKPTPLGDDPTYSVSQTKERVTSSIGFSWNILDFGLSYIRAKQQSDKYLIAKEKERKVVQNITQEVRRAYYQAISAQELLERINAIISETNRAIADSKSAKELKFQSPMQALTYQRELYEILRTLSTLKKKLISAKTELSQLIGLKPGTKFELAQKIQKEYEIPHIPYNIEQMEKIALLKRPELQESRYKVRITKQEITAARLSMLPRLNINSTMYFDDSDYLLNNDWHTYGANVSWNLFEVFFNAQKTDVAKHKVEIAKKQKIAIYMSVISQVHLAYINFYQAQHDYQIAKGYLDVADEIFNIIRTKNEQNMNSRLILIKEKLNYVLAVLRHSLAYAEMQNNYGKILLSMGDLHAFDSSVHSSSNIKNTLTANSSAIAVVKKKAILRKLPTTKSDIVTTLKIGARIEVESKLFTDEGYWYKSTLGYIHSSLVNIQR
jgi:outer membrane protein TolC